MRTAASCFDKFHFNWKSTVREDLRISSVFHPNAIRARRPDSLESIEVYCTCQCNSYSKSMKNCKEIRTFLVPRIRICTSVVGTVLFSAFFCITFYGELNFAVFIFLGELMLELCNAWD